VYQEETVDGEGCPKNSIQITIKVKKLKLSTQGYNKQLHVKKSHFIVTIFLHT